MLKYFLIGLIAVHTSLQLEVVPDQRQEEDNSAVEAKKYFKQHEFKGKHKKYKGEEEWREQYDGHGKKRHGDESGKWIDGEKKTYSGKNNKPYKENKAKQARSVARVDADLENYQNSKPIDLTSDLNVNNMPQAYNKDSEVLAPIKRDFYKEMQNIDLSSPPDPNNTILMARYILHNVDWVSVATITNRLGAKNYPFSNVLSMSDGPLEQGSGVPFFYVTPMDLTTQDLLKENKASVSATLAQTTFCRNQVIDPQDPRCGRLILSGKIKKVKPQSVEETFATKALFSRHPVMKTWPNDHDFYIAKLKIGQIILLDQFGGAKYLDVEQYLHPDTNNNNN